MSLARLSILAGAGRSYEGEGCGSKVDFLAGVGPQRYECSTGAAGLFSSHKEQGGHQGE